MNRFMTALPFFADNAGEPLNSGQVYIGLPNLNPMIAPVNLFWDQAGTIPASQPLSVKNGVIVNGSIPSNVFYTQSSVSVSVLDAYGIQVVYAPTNIALNTDASVIPFVRTDAGAVQTDLLTKLRSMPRTPLDFGLLGDWVQGDTGDDTPVLNQMMAATLAGNKGIVPLGGGIFYINSQVVVPEDCGIDGGISAGKPTNIPFGLRKSTFVCGPNGNFLLNRGSVLKNVNVIAAPCTTPPTTTAGALATIAAFSGIAININGSDVRIENPTVVGFNLAIKSNGQDRPTIIGARIDCTNGIDIQQCFDVARIHDAHIWPFWSANIDGLATTVLVRSGTGINITNTADGTLVTCPLVYGFQQGINLQNVFACKISDAWIDNFLTVTASSSGIRTAGSVVACGFSNCHVDSHATNYNLGHNVSPGITMTGCTAGACKTRQLLLGPGSGGQVVAFSTSSAQAGAAAEIEAQAGINYWMIGFMRVEGSQAAVFASIANGDKPNLYVNPVKITNGPAYNL